jgi:hypothetical protein
MNEAPILGLLAAIAPQLNAAQAETPQASVEEAPHDSYAFWNGFFDGVNPEIEGSGQKAMTRGPKDQLPDPGVQTQYLQYQGDAKKLRFANEIGKEELLDHEGDVSVGISLSQYRPAIGSPAANDHAVQLRLDTTQVYPFRNLISPLAWTAIASVVSDKSNYVSLDRLGLKTDQAAQGTSKILLTRGTGKIAVNISRAPQASMFVKVLGVIMQGLSKRPEFPS